MREAMSSSRAVEQDALGKGGEDDFKKHVLKTTNSHLSCLLPFAYVWEKPKSLKEASELSRLTLATGFSLESFLGSDGSYVQPKTSEKYSGRGETMNATIKGELESGKKNSFHTVSFALSGCVTTVARVVSLRQGGGRGWRERSIDLLCW